ncbi:transposase domain-containing protein [Acinetobacter baumannii]
MTLIQSAKLNGLDPYAYLSDVLKRLPTHKVPSIEELLPHRWKPEPPLKLGDGVQRMLTELLFV